MSLVGAAEVARRPRWLVIGSSGFVGSALSRHLADMGDQVVTMSAPRLECKPDLPAEQICHLAESHELVSEMAQAFRAPDRVILAAGLATPDAQWSPALVGANSLLPGVVLCAAQRAEVSRFLHISSAAVQGRVRRLTESTWNSPFSAYSRSKALGESVVLRLASSGGTEAVIVRATSVQGSQRDTTKNLRRIARSRLASVAGSGTQPSSVSSIDSLAEFIRTVGAWPGPLSGIVLQPWEQLSVREVLTAAGGKAPIALPRCLCHSLVTSGFTVSKLLGGRLDGPVRRVEVMWFGQEVVAEWAQHAGFSPPTVLLDILRGDPT